MLDLCKLSLVFFHGLLFLLEHPAFVSDQDTLFTLSVLLSSVNLVFNVLGNYFVDLLHSLLRLLEHQLQLLCSLFFNQTDNLLPLPVLLRNLVLLCSQGLLRERPVDRTRRVVLPQNNLGKQTLQLVFWRTVHLFWIVSTQLEKRVQLLQIALSALVEVSEVDLCQLRIPFVLRQLLKVLQ